MSDEIGDGLDDATLPNERFPNLAVGKYRLKIIRAIQGVTSKFAKKPNNPFLKVSVDVLESQGAGATPVGTQADIFLGKDSYGYYLKDIKALLSAVLDEAPKQITKSTLNEFTSDDQPAAGNEFLAEGYTNEKSDFVKLRFAPIKA